MEVGSWVWYQSESDGYIPTQVLNIDKDTTTVETEAGGEHTCSTESLTIMTEAPGDAVDDMVTLSDLNEPALVHNLRLRFGTDDIFCWIGPILIACNPYKKLAIFTPGFMDEYSLKAPGTSLTPHVYDLANAALTDMKEGSGANQSIVISGESGAGKTEETKQCLQFLAHVAKDDTIEVGPEQLLLGSSPILEAFGNAKTTKNDNSSRFGKYLEIHFEQVNGRPTIRGGKTLKYLLEKSRVIGKMGQGERNYHICYYMAHLSDEQKKELKYTRAEDFLYASKAGCTTVAGLDDKAALTEVTEAWEQVGVPTEEVMAVYRIVAGVLYLSNVAFEAGADGNALVTNEEVLTPCCALLKADPDILETTLTFRNMATGGRSIVVIPMLPEKAVESQEGLAKAIYSKLFDFIVERLNETVVAPPGNLKSIGVLDIFGFEILESNSFEQLCINLANEKLQAHFNSFVFGEEMKIYKKEGLNLANISYADNQACLDLLELKRTGVFAMLDEECVVPKGSDVSLLQKMADLHRKNPFWGKPPKGSRTSFVINHFAGGVPYDVTGFLEKNNDICQPDLQSFMSESDDPLIRRLFPAPEPKKGRQPTLGGQFKTSLQELYEKLMSTAPSFIKCIKSNQVKQPGLYDATFTLKQIRYLGLLEVIAIRKQGFPIRRTPKEMFARYQLLDAKARTARDIMTNLKIDSELWQMGKSLFFMKDECFTDMESRRAAKVEESALALQSFFKAELARKSWGTVSDGVVLAQGLVRAVLGREQARTQTVINETIDILEHAIKAKDLDELEVAISRAGSTVGVDQELVQQAVKLLEQLNKVAGVQKLLQLAVEKEQEADLQYAIAEAAAIDYSDKLVLEAKKILMKLQSANAAKGKEANEVGVRKELEKALKDKTDGEPKRKKLIVALNNAESLGAEFMEDELVKKAQSALQDVVVSMDILEALSTAIEKKNRSLLEAALAKADSSAATMNYLVKSKVADAREALTEMVEQEEAEKAVQAAMRTGNKIGIAKALATAKAAGVSKETLDAQEALVEETASTQKAATRAGKTAFLAEVEELPYMDRIQQMEPVFGKVTAFDSVRSKEMSITYTKIPIKKPMTRFFGKSAAALEKKAVNLFVSVLGYMGERKIEYPEMLASELLQEGIDTEEMRDEIYLQIVKQCTRNETPSLIRGWQLLVFCLRTFPPSPAFAPYVEVYLYKSSTGEGIRNDEKQQVVAVAQTAIRRLQTRLKEGPREFAITKEEIEAARNQQAIQATVYFADHSMKKFEVDEEMTIMQLKEIIAIALKIQVVDTYALYDVSNIADPLCLETDQKVLGLMREWEKPPEALSKGKGLLKKLKRKAAKPVHKLMLSKRLWTNPTVIPSDPVELHLTYAQAQGYVIHGKYNANDTEALLLAALALQIEYGDHNPNRHTAGFLGNIMEDYIPPHLFRLQRPEIWEADLARTHEKMVGFSELMAKTNYLRVCHKFTGYGYTFFLGKQKHIKKCPKLVYVGVNHVGAAVFRTDDKTIVQEFPMSAMQGWDSSATSLTLKTGGKAFEFQMRSGDDVCGLLKDYALWMAAKAQKKKKKSGVKH